MKQFGQRYNAYQSFLLGCKTFWLNDLYAEVKSETTEKLGRGTPASVGDIATTLKDNTVYKYYAWMERHLQKMKYSGRYGIIPSYEPYRAELEAWLDQHLPEGLLSLDPELDLPAYFTEIDVHQHPGGTCGDSLAGIVYDRGARSMWPTASKDLSLHERFDTVVKGICNPSRIVDLGCGFGKSARGFYQDFPGAAVTGIDISAPCLKLAARIAVEDNAGNIAYRQARAEQTGLKSEGYDLVTSTMLLHEMPPNAVRETIAESFRLLEKGGYAIHLDYLAGKDAFNRFIHYGHGKRNNEPYMEPLDKMDLQGALREAGFENIEIAPFEEAPNALSPDTPRWRLPWVTVAAQKPND